ncbi:uncharacterized protein LOC123722988 [Papilio machaon]|uniref:uncharacterized protein LOC123722988 n=1 Tax=Papilio machaon TaxID=76193 RepID=UPI001E665B50|nr:uncharacterized protein LOC123722988 [Papilio machaon]
MFPKNKSPLCNKCHEAVSDFVLCRECENRYHHASAGITENAYRRMGQEKRANWKCTSCRNPSPENPVLADLLNEIKCFREDFCTMKSDFNSFKSEIHCIAQSVQDLTNKWSDLELRLNNMESRLEIAEGKTSVIMDSMKDFENTNQYQDQFSRLNNLELSGVPSHRGENLNKILGDLCNFVGFTLLNTDVDTIHRVRPYNNPASDATNLPLRHPAIVIRFCQRRRKDELLAAMRARRGLTTADLGMHGPALPVYLSDHLTPHNKLL